MAKIRNLLTFEERGSILNVSICPERNIKESRIHLRIMVNMKLVPGEIILEWDQWTKLLTVRQQIGLEVAAE